MKKKSTEWSTVLIVIVIVFGLFFICLPIFIPKEFLSTDEFLELSSILFSWPVAIMIIFLIFISRFRTSIDTFLRNIRSVKYRGLEIQGSIAESESPDEGSANIKQLIKSHKRANEEKRGLEQKIDKAYTEMYLWKFQYLNYFYVLNTKSVLQWFSSQSQTEHYFHILWYQIIPDVQQRKTILDVLLEHGMLEKVGEKIQITPEGKAFLQFIGFGYPLFQPV